jgi:hypothetical protein
MTKSFVSIAVKSALVSLAIGSSTLLVQKPADAQWQLWVPNVTEKLGNGVNGSRGFPLGGQIFEQYVQPAFDSWNNRSSGTYSQSQSGSSSSFGSNFQQWNNNSPGFNDYFQPYNPGCGGKGCLGW